MSQRNFKYLHDNRIIYGRTPITDVPTESTDIYDYYENGTYECYALFRSKAKITTFKSLKWHFLVIQHLNTELNLKQLKKVFEYIANIKNNFVTFTMSRGAFDKLVNDVLQQMQNVHLVIVYVKLYLNQIRFSHCLKNFQLWVS